MSEIVCPKCGSNQLNANKKGFSGTKALIGDALVGPVGLLAGTIGSNKIKITCISCGNTFSPPSKLETYAQSAREYEQSRVANMSPKDRIVYNSPEQKKKRNLPVVIFVIGVIISLISSYNPNASVFDAVNYTPIWIFVGTVILTVIVSFQINNKRSETKRGIDEWHKEDNEVAKDGVEFECSHCGYRRETNFFYCPKCGKSEEGFTKTM